MTKSQIYRIIKAVKEGKDAKNRQYPKNEKWDVSQAKRGVKVIDNPLFSPYLTPTDFFLFPMLKKELAGVTMTHEEFMKEWCRLLRSTTKEEFGTAFAKWLERCEKCVRIGSIYVEKPKKLNALQSLIV